MKVILGHGFEEMTTQLLRNEAIAEVMSKLKIYLNNGSRIDGRPTPLLPGDYIDGLDLSGIAAPPNGTAPQAWNDTYKNNRILIAGFNIYKGVGDTENTENHLLFTARNFMAKGRMNATNTNIGGYPDSELRVWLEGANGDGDGAFANGLKTALFGQGMNSFAVFQKLHSTKGGSAWNQYTVYLPTEIEIHGFASYGDEAHRMNTNVQFPIYQKIMGYRVKRWNGSRFGYWTGTPTANFSDGFTVVKALGEADAVAADQNGYGISPTFCIRD